MSDDSIRVAHVVPTLSRLGGGVTTYVLTAVRHGLDAGIDPVVAGLWDPHAEEDTSEYRDIEILLAKRIGPRSAGYSPHLRRLLEAQLSQPNNNIAVVHSHGLRMLPSYEARRAALKHKLPLIVSPHGQLDPWVLANNRTRKWLIARLFEDGNLHAATGLHATANQEARYFRDYGLKNPIAVVPIGLDASLYPTHLDDDDDEILKQWPVLAGKKRLLFLSSIYRKKGLHRLAQAWVKLHQKLPDWQLAIGGVELDDSCQLARGIIETGGANKSTTFLGPLTESLKRTMLASADLYVLPTDGENFSIAVAEALACQLPPIVSNTTPWAGVRDHDCGWWIDVGVEPLCDAILDATSRSDEERRAMGERARTYIERDFNWPSIARRLRELYDWAAGRSSKPAFVYEANDPIGD